MFMPCRNAVPAAARRAEPPTAGGGELRGLGDGGAGGGRSPAGRAARAGRRRGRRRRQHAAQHGDRDRPADLAQRAVHRGPGAGLAAHGGHDGVHGGGHRRAGAEPAQGQPGATTTYPVARCIWLSTARPPPAAPARRPRSASCPPPARPGRPARDQQPGHHREQAQARAERVIAEHALQVLGEGEQDREQRHRDAMVATVPQVNRRSRNSAGSISGSPRAARGSRRRRTGPPTRPAAPRWPAPSSRVRGR